MNQVQQTSNQNNQTTQQQSQQRQIISSSPKQFLPLTSNSSICEANSLALIDSTPIVVNLNSSSAQSGSQQQMIPQSSSVASSSQNPSQSQQHLNHSQLIQQQDSSLQNNQDNCNNNLLMPPNSVNPPNLIINNHPNNQNQNSVNNFSSGGGDGNNRLDGRNGGGAVASNGNRVAQRNRQMLNVSQDSQVLGVGAPNQLSSQRNNHLNGNVGGVTDQQQLGADNGVVDASRPEYCDPDLVCFKVGQLEFFTRADYFATHSEYFARLYMQNLDDDHHRNNLPQLVLNLPSRAKPSALLLVIDLVESGKNEHALDTSTVDFTTALEMLVVADLLKMRHLEARLIQEVILQGMNRQNCLRVLSMAHKRASSKSNEYYLSEILQHTHQSNKKSSKREEKKGSDQLDEGEYDDDEEDNVGDENESVAVSIRSVSRSNSSSQGGAGAGAGQGTLVQHEICHDENEDIEEVKDSEEKWHHLLGYSIDLTALHLPYILRVNWNGFSQLIEKELAFAVISKSLYFYKVDSTVDLTPLIEKLVALRNFQSVFELLKHERAQILLNATMNLAEDNADDPLLVWSVNNLSSYFYKQSDLISVQGAFWRLTLSYFKKQSNCLKVDIKIQNNPYDAKKQKEYFKKSELGVAVNYDREKIDPVARFEVQQLDPAYRQQKIDQLNAGANAQPNHSIVTFVSNIEIKDLVQKTKPILSSMICGQKAPVQLLEVPDFELEPGQEQTIDINLYFKVKNFYGSLLYFISRNFQYLVGDPAIKHLQKDDLKLILRHKFLNVPNEDEVVKGVIQWAEGQQLDIKPLKGLDLVRKGSFSSQKSNQNVLNNRMLQDDLGEVLLGINWDFVSLPCLVDIIRTVPLFRTNQVFKEKVRTQFQIRATKQTQESLENASGILSAEARFCYKYNQSQRSLYPNEADLRFQDDKFIQAISGDKNQFQLVFPVQLYPNFLAHLTDCILSQVKIIETQSDNIPISKRQHQNQYENGGVPSLVPQNRALSDTSNMKIAKINQKQRKVHLYQKLLQKQAEIKNLQDQLQALDLLDELQNVNQHTQNNGGGEANKNSKQAYGGKQQQKMIENEQRLHAAKERFNIRVQNFEQEKKQQQQGRSKNPSDPLEDDDLNDNDSDQSLSNLQKKDDNYRKLIDAPNMKREREKAYGDPGEEAEDDEPNLDDNDISEYTPTKNNQDLTKMVLGKQQWIPRVSNKQKSELRLSQNSERFIARCMKQIGQSSDTLNVLHAPSQIIINSPQISKKEQVILQLDDSVEQMDKRSNFMSKIMQTKRTEEFKEVLIEDSSSSCSQNQSVDLKRKLEKSVEKKPQKVQNERKAKTSKSKEIKELQMRSLQSGYGNLSQISERSSTMSRVSPPEQKSLSDKMTQQFSENLQRSIGEYEQRQYQFQQHQQQQQQSMMLFPQMNQHIQQIFPSQQPTNPIVQMTSSSSTLQANVLQISIESSFCRQSPPQPENKLNFNPDEKSMMPLTSPHAVLTNDLKPSGQRNHHQMGNNINNTSAQTNSQFLSQGQTKSNSLCGSYTQSSLGMTDNASSSLYDLSQQYWSTILNLQNVNLGKSNEFQTKFIELAKLYAQEETKVHEQLQDEVRLEKQVELEEDHKDFTPKKSRKSSVASNSSKKQIISPENLKQIQMKLKKQSVNPKQTDITKVEKFIKADSGPISLNQLEKKEQKITAPYVKRMIQSEDFFNDKSDLESRESEQLSQIQSQQSNESNKKVPIRKSSTKKTIQVSVPPQIAKALKIKSLEDQINLNSSSDRQKKSESVEYETSIQKSSHNESSVQKMKEKANFNLLDHLDKAK